MDKHPPLAPVFPDEIPARCEDGTITHADGTIELNGELFEVDWNELDPPEGHPDAEEIDDDVVWAGVCDSLGLAPGTL
jgi:hypothetical protein